MCISWNIARQFNSYFIPNGWMHNMLRVCVLSSSQIWPRHKAYVSHINGRDCDTQTHTLEPIFSAQFKSIYILIAIKCTMRLRQLSRAIHLLHFIPFYMRLCWLSFFCLSFIVILFHISLNDFLIYLSIGVYLFFVPTLFVSFDLATLRYRLPWNEPSVLSCTYNNHAIDGLFIYLLFFTSVIIYVRCMP